MGLAGTPASRCTRRIGAQMIFDYVTPDQPIEAVDGYVPTHWGTTNVIRARAMPTNPQTPAQTYARNLITVLSMTWETDLTDAQRMGWGTYAFNSPLTTSWNTPKYINGYSHFLRSNRPRPQFGLPLAIDAPTDYGLATHTTPRSWVSADATQLLVAIAPSDVWASNDGGYLMLWYSRPTSPTRTRPTETYKPLASIAGATAGIPSLATIPLPADWQKPPMTPWVRNSATNPQGQLSQ